METAATGIKEEKGTSVTTKSKKKKGFWKGFLNFLACGGFLLVLIVIVGIVIAISVIFK
jgi:hypothetical protein